MSVVSLENVSKRFGHFDAVSQVNLESQDGEFIALVGPSGCGKTTTMRMLAGLEKTSDGHIRMDGADVTYLSPKERDVAMVFQNYALYPHLSVYENMAFCLKVRRWKRDAIRQQIENIAEMLELGSLLGRTPGELSGGQRQRVALGRAIVREPRMFLMDEPLSNLDAKLRIEMRAQLSKICRRLGVTTFYVTHDQLEAMTMGHRIVVMHDGRVQQVDSPQNIYDNPVNQFVAGFIGSPPMNFLEAQVSDCGTFVEGPGFRLRVSESLAVGVAREGAKEVVAGIRPEHLAPAPTDETGDAGWAEGDIELIETLGTEVLVQVRVGHELILAQFDRDTALRVGDAVRLTPRKDSVHAFELGSGRSVMAA